MSNSNLEAVAIDLGSALVKIIVTDKHGKISQNLVINNNLGFSVPMNQTQADSLSSFIGEIFTQNKLPRRGLRLAMPEKLTSTQVIEIPTLTDAELATSINWQAQQYIPIPKEDLALNYQVLYRPEKKDEAISNMRVLLIGINKNHLGNLMNAYKKAGLEPTLLETETIATLRNLQPETTNLSSMVVNFGASGLDLAILKNNELSLAISHQTGSNMITKALMTTFNLPMDKAEAYKKEYGVNASFFEGKIANAIAPIAQSILSDIKNTITFFNNKNNLQTISKLYFCGGGSLMPGFPELLAANLNLEIIPLDIFSTAQGAVPEKDQLLYPIAYGLTKRQ